MKPLKLATFIIFVATCASFLWPADGAVAAVRLAHLGKRVVERSPRAVPKQPFYSSSRNTADIPLGGIDYSGQC